MTLSRKAIIRIVMGNNQLFLIMQKLQNNRINYFCIKKKKLHSIFIDIFPPKYTASPPEWSYEGRKIVMFEIL